MHLIIKTKEPPESDAVRARLLFYYRPKAGVNISALIPLLSLGRSERGEPDSKMLELVERAGKS